LPSNSSNAALRTVSNRAVRRKLSTVWKNVTQTYPQQPTGDRRPSVRTNNHEEPDLTQRPFSSHGLLPISLCLQQYSTEWFHIIDLRSMNLAATKIANGTCGLMLSRPVLFSPRTSYAMLRHASRQHWTARGQDITNPSDCAAVGYARR
jgi:hypothetical protein